MKTMKNIAFFLLLLPALLATAGIRAQTPPRDVLPLELTDNTQVEILGMLKLLGVRAWRFDTEGLSDGRYRFTPYFDEYAAGEKVEKENQFLFTMTQDWKEKLSDPGEWNKFLAENDPRLSEDGEKYLKPLDGIGVFAVPSNDSVVTVQVDVYGIGALSSRLQLQPLQNSENNLRYSYNYRPFRIAPFESGKLRIPLLLAGSFWWDEKIRSYRFCATNEFAPDLSDEELKLIPHYYIIGIEVERIE